MYEKLEFLGNSGVRIPGELALFPPVFFFGVHAYAVRGSRFFTTTDGGGLRVRFEHILLLVYRG